MALNWNLDDAVEREGRDYFFNAEGDAHAVTQTILMATMAVDMGSITDANATAFYARLRAYELLNGLSLTPYEDVWRHRGLRVNVATATDAAFWKQLRTLQDQHAKAASRRFHGRLD